MNDPDHAGGGLRRAPMPLPAGFLPAGTPFPDGIDGIRSAGNGFVLDDDESIAAARRRAIHAIGHASTAPVPTLDAAGNLPAGVQAASRGELLARFGGTPRRSALLLDQLPVALAALHGAGVDSVIVGGSLVGAKPAPGDVDLGWVANPRTTTDGVEHALAQVRHAAPDVSAHRADRLVLNAPMIDGATPGWNFLELFQHDRLGRERGVLLLPTSEAALGAVTTGASIREAAARQALRGLRLLGSL